MMELDRQDDSHIRFSLTPFEKWVVALIVGSLISMLGWIGHNFSQQLSEQNASLQRLTVQIAVTNAQMTTLASQLADVPGMAKLLAELKVEVADNTRRIDNLEQMRRVK